MRLPTRLKAFLFASLSLVVALTLSFGVAEGIVRLKNASMRDYNTEMWRYGRELKLPSADPRLGHEHIANSHAVLQSVNIRTNNWGLRGGPVSDAPAPGTRRILMLGSSIALGWGVDEDKVVSSFLEKKFEADGQHVEVLNGGVGNYNAERYVERFLTRLAPLQPTDLLILAFVRDGEELTRDSGNILLRNSQLALTAWVAATRVMAKASDGLVEHYKRVYAPGSPSLALMQAELGKLAKYAREHDIRVTLAMVPDVHVDLTRYPLGFVHEVFAQAARDNGFAYVDLLPAFQGLRPEDIWAMPGDPHPNARGHALMADAIYGVLAQAREAKGTR